VFSGNGDFGRTAEFERIALPHLSDLARFARRLTGTASAAEDLVQETYLLAWKGFRTFERGTNVRAWLFRILLNRDLAGRRRPRTEAVPLDQADSRFQLRTDPSIEVNDALDRLSEEQRTVLLLNVVEGFTCREIADILSVPFGTVMSRLARARENMRALLAPAAAKVSR
jgi:RNA polymerase sigma-70 factor (ECF subfamily)